MNSPDDFTPDELRTILESAGTPAETVERFVALARDPKFRATLVDYLRKEVESLN